MVRICVQDSYLGAHGHSVSSISHSNASGRLVPSRAGFSWVALPAWPSETVVVGANLKIKTTLFSCMHNCQGFSFAQATGSLVKRISTSRFLARNCLKKP